MDEHQLLSPWILKRSIHVKDFHLIESQIALIRGGKEGGVKKEEFYSFFIRKKGLEKSVNKQQKRLSVCVRINKK